MDICHAGHIALDREDAAGFRAFVKRGRELLENGASLAIFPEGTRSMDGRLAAFKNGAFTIATKAHVCIARVLPSSVFLDPISGSSLYQKGTIEQNSC